MIKHVLMSVTVLATANVASAAGIPVEITLRSTDPAYVITGATAKFLTEASLPIVGVCGRLMWPHPFSVPAFIGRTELATLDARGGTSGQPDWTLTGSYDRGLCGFKTDTLYLNFTVAGDPIPYKLVIHAHEMDEGDPDPAAQTAHCQRTTGRHRTRNECHTPYNSGPSRQSDNLYQLEGEPVRYEFDLTFAE